MTIKKMIEDYTAARKEILDKAAGLKKIKEPDQYDYINELDEINEELYVLANKKYEIPAQAVDAIIIEGIENNTMTIPQMQSNMEEFDKFLHTSLNFVKDTAAKPYGIYLTRLNDLATQLNTAIDYVAKKDLFSETDITSSGYIVLDAPEDIEYDDTTKILKWHKVERAITYNVFYKDSTESVYTKQIGASAEPEYNFITLDLSSLAAGTYDIKIQANSDNEAYQSSYAETSITIS